MSTVDPRGAVTGSPEALAWGRVRCGFYLGARTAKRPLETSAEYHDRLLFEQGYRAALAIRDGAPEVERIGVVDDSGGGWVSVFVDRDLVSYPDDETVVYVARTLTEPVSP